MRPSVVLRCNYDNGDCDGEFGYDRRAFVVGCVEKEASLSRAALRPTTIKTTTTEAADKTSSLI